MGPSSSQLQIPPPFAVNLCKGTYSPREAQAAAPLFRSPGKPGCACIAVHMFSWLSAVVFFPVRNCIQGPDFCLFLCNQRGCLREGKGHEKSYQTRTGGKKGQSSLELQLDALTAPGWVQVCLLAPEAVTHLTVTEYFPKDYMGLALSGSFYFHQAYSVSRLTAYLAQSSRNRGALLLCMGNFVGWLVGFFPPETLLL